MSRKDIIKSYTVFEAEDASTSFDNKDNPTDISSMDNAGIAVLWTGTPEGIFKVWVSNDKADYTADRPVVNWIELDFGSPVIIDNSDVAHVINMNQLSFSWLAMGYDSSSGAGTLTAKLSSKQV